jgi:uncharacterized protein YehS (DUF1456 family)
LDNNDRLIRIRYALDIKDTDMVKIFKLGGLDLEREDIDKLLIKSTDHYHDEARSHFEEEETQEQEENIYCSDLILEAFLDGFIIFKRGEKEKKPGEPERPKGKIDQLGSINNVMLKKLKIALSLSSEDMLEILQEAGVAVTKGELSALFRKEGHKHYRVCGDNYARNFLKGLGMRYR